MTFETWFKTTYPQFDPEGFVADAAKAAWAVSGETLKGVLDIIGAEYCRCLETRTGKCVKCRVGELIAARAK